MDNNITTLTTDILSAITDIDPLQKKGKVVEAYGTTIKVTGIAARIGQQCLITDKYCTHQVYADVVGITDDKAILLPLNHIGGIAQDSEVIVIKETTTISFSKKMIGKVLDGLGNPINGALTDNNHKEIPIYCDAPNPLKRTPITQPLRTGIRAIDALLPLGVGQRTGIFAPAGAGKSTLLSMLARHTRSDIIIIALIGERGREVREFIEHTLTKESLSRSILIVSTSDRPAMERLRAAYTATAIAENFRSQGYNVLFLMDSVTRFARALREIGLSIGEPPVRRGYPPSVFAELPKLFERTGNDDHGSISAFYTVLMEDEQTTDPIAEEVRSLLDGHIVLTRKLAEENHYPAIDVLKSTSRIQNLITDTEHQELIKKFKSMLSKYYEIEFLIHVGEYEEGSDSVADEAIRKYQKMKDYLRQNLNTKYEFAQLYSLFEDIVNG
ncbi:MAG: FliI/YscN family ATPase [Candidatus Thiodiazotropha sp.]